MPGELIDLLERLDPELTLEDIHRRADDAINTFTGHAAQITEWSDFRRVVLEFCRHVEACILNLSEPVSGGDDFDWGRFFPAINATFGPSGEKAAFELARTGAEGGFYRVLRTLALALADKHAAGGVAGFVSGWWNELSFDEQMCAVDKYLERFGDLLPSEMTEGNAGRLRADFPRVLQKHPELVRHFRRVGR